MPELECMASVRQDLDRLGQARVVPAERGRELPENRAELAGAHERPERRVQPLYSFREPDEPPVPV